MDAPTVAILFWFYKNERVCANRVRHLRRLNPDTPIYGLYGGPRANAQKFERALPELDDFWSYPDEAPASWAWRNGDLLIRRWHTERGRDLVWDSVFVVQWDMVLTKPLSRLLSLERDDFLVSDLRAMHEVEAWWVWVNGDERAEYDAFCAHVRNVHGFAGEPLSCVFVVACLPRSFLDRFAAVERPELGFLEYKLPTYAAAFGYRLVSDPRFRCWRAADPATRTAPPSQRMLHGYGSDVRLRTILTNRELGVYHPYRALFPFEAAAVPWVCAQQSWRAIRRVARAGVNALTLSR